MKAKQIFSPFYLILPAVMLAWAPSSFATFHFADVVEIYSNVDGTVQYIEYRMTTNGQQELGGESLSSNGNNFVFPGDLASNITSNQSWLAGTNAFAALPGAVTPDYIIPANFFSINGDTITLVGGAFTPMTFGSGVLPMDGINALQKNLTTAVNSPTNFAGETGSVDTSTPPADPNNLFVDFNSGSNGNGADVSPFNILIDAIAVANIGATINLTPGTSDETFAGLSSISKPLTLVNNDPGSGLVIIGQGAIPPSPAEPNGFVSRTARNGDNE